MKQSNLLATLQSKLEGDVLFDRTTRHIYATDASDFRKVPMGVIHPKHVDDLATAVKIAAEFKTPIIPRGGGSSVSGQTVGTGIVIDHTKYLNRLLEVNTEERWALVESGLNLDKLNQALRKHGLMVGPDPSSSAVATIGGMVGNNSTGSHSVKYRQIADHIKEIEVVLSDGSVVTMGDKSNDEVQQLAGSATLEGRLYKEIPSLLDRYQKEIEQAFPSHWRNVAGYALNRLWDTYKKNGHLNLAPFIAGSEGTLVSISKVKLGLVLRPHHTRLVLLPFENLSSALEQVPSILEQPVAAVELMTFPTLQLAFNHPIYGSRLKRFINDLPGSILIVEFAGDDPADLNLQSELLTQRLLKSGYQNTPVHCGSPEEIDQVWSIRKAVKGLQDSQPGATKRINVIDDPAVPVEQLVSFTREVTKIGEQYGVDLNFDAHASVGCLHLSPAINLRSPEGLHTMELMAKEIMTIAIAHHGTTTGEHGEGLARSFFNRQLYGDRLHQAFHDIKNLFDPQNQFNPYKILKSIEPWNKEWLKYHPAYNTDLAPKETYFDYGVHGNFAGLIEMCNGQGTCRSQVVGTMCPSFRITGEEKDTPRGRANILREALTGNLGKEGLLSQEVYETLDLCLECKACKAECSSGLDVAKLKYEFLTHYQKANGPSLRSRVFASLSQINRWASTAPRLTNWIFRQPVFKKSLERILKIDHRRELPEVATLSFKKWFKGRASNQAAPLGSVILWVDCHLKDNQPELGKAAVIALEALGFDIKLIEGTKCCGRPMISKGFLDKARANAETNINLLAPWAEKGIPIIGIEPSCVACFRDEYVELVPTKSAKKVAEQTFFIEEFIYQTVRNNKVTIPFNTNTPRRHILAHTHCYQKSLDQSDQVIQFLKLIPNTTVEEIGDGCCGMAGSFGYEKEHYDLSMAIGEKNLFTYIRSAPSGTEFAAAGTSCRHQIKDGTQVTACHPITLFADAIKDIGS